MLGNVRRVEEPEYPTDGVRVRTVELCLALVFVAFFNSVCLSRSIAAMIGMAYAGSSGSAGSSAAGPSVPAAGTAALVALVRWELMRRSCIKSKGLTTGSLARFTACSSAVLRGRASSSDPPPRAHHCHCHSSRLSCNWINPGRLTSYKRGYLLRFYRNLTSYRRGY